MKSENIFQKLAGTPVIGPPINGFIGLLLPLGIYHLFITNYIDAGNAGAGLFILLWNAPIVFFCKVVYRLSLALGTLILVFGIYEFVTDSTNLSSGMVILVMVLTTGIMVVLLFSLMAREEGDAFFDPLNDILRIFVKTKPDISQGISGADVEAIEGIIREKTKFELISMKEENGGVIVRTGWVQGHLWTLYREDGTWTVVQKQKHRRGGVVDAVEQGVAPNA